MTVARKSITFFSSILNSVATKGLHPSAKFLGTMAAPKGRPYTIIVEGNIGSGKTTFLQQFLENHKDKVEILAEPIEMWRNCQGNNLLQLMYKDPTRYSLMFQTYVQLTMVKYHNKITEKPIRMMERSINRYCFVENLYNNGLMLDCEYSVQSEWFNFLITCPQLNFKVDEIIYLRTRPEVAYERILKRNRFEENNLSLKYLQDLHTLHEDWLVEKTKFQPLAAKVTVIDANDDLSVIAEKFSTIKEDIIEKYS